MHGNRKKMFLKSDLTSGWSFLGVILLYNVLPVAGSGAIVQERCES